LEEIIPKNLLSEPPEVDNLIIFSEVLDDALLSCDPVSQEVARTASRASSTLECGLARGDAPTLNTIDSSHPVPLGVAKGASALEVAVADGPATKGGAGSDPALEGIGAGSPSAASMDVHIGSPSNQFEEPTVTRLSAAAADLVTLEASDPNARSLPPADEAEVPPSRAFDVIPIDIPSSSNAPILLALGLPLFLSNLQVNQLSFFTAHTSKLYFLLISS
jgi:hypothetical protein